MLQDQDFASILRGEGSVTLLRDLRSFWGSHPQFWFSHAPIEHWDTVQVPYTDCLDINMHLVLAYDQIARHPGMPRSEAGFRFATALALRMLHNGQYAAAAPWERVFLLLALRHNASSGLKELALRKALQEAEADPSSLWCRFVNATVWDVHCWRERAGYPAEPEADLHSLQTFQRLLEPPRVWGSVRDLSAIVRPVLAGMADGQIAVSLSGGVDSMVLATVCRDVCRELGLGLIFLHISYKNRKECEDECNLLRWYSQILGVPLHVRRITEMQRVRTAGLREVYEDVTRRIRFAFYRHFGCPVLLGHNLDDCYENMFRNLSQQIHWENLAGMSVCGQEQGVAIVRPFLSVPKVDILAYADTTGIPHLYDSTPAWSQRGQMRDRLLPGIRGFDPLILPGLAAFAERARFLEAEWEHGFEDWCRRLERSGNGECIIPKDAYYHRNVGERFWIRLFQWLGWPRPSKKSLGNFAEMLGRRLGRCNLSGSSYAIISRTAIVLVSSDSCEMTG